MPWHISKGHSECPSSKPWAVVKDSDGEVEGCHETKAKAQRQIAALNASEANKATAGRADYWTWEPGAVRVSKLPPERQARADAARRRYTGQE